MAGAADQCVGANTGTNGRSGGCPGVAAGKRTRPRKGCGRDHIPQHPATGRITYIDTELGDAADIMLVGPAGPEKVQLSGRDDPT